MLDYRLDAETEALRKTVREFAQEVIAPQIGDFYERDEFPTQIVRQMGELGLFGLPFPEEYGGAGGTYFDLCVALEELARVDSSMAITVEAGVSLGAMPIFRFGTEEQKREWLPRLCSGEALGCFALTEPDTGSDVASLRTRATRSDGGWVISGQKMFISLGNYAELALVFAQTDPEKGYRGLACFLVPTSDDGYHAQEIHGKLGLRASDTASISLENVEVPDDAMLGEVGDGFKVAMSALDNGRYSVAAGCVGICEGCVDASVSYSTERRQFGVPVARFQLVQELIAEMVMKRDAARLLVRRAGILKDKGEPNTVETSIAKLYATEAAVECANAAIQVHGGSGYVDDHPVERYLRDARVTTLYEGTSQIHKLIIGRGATGIDAMRPMRADNG